MRWFFVVNAWLLVVATALHAQTGYQSSQLAPDPAQKSVQIPESVLMRAGYETRRHDCVDAGQHIDAVLKDRPTWAAAYALQLICEREAGNDTDQRATLNHLLRLQPGNWVWWRDSAMLHARDAELSAAFTDMDKAIQMRPWDAALYASRSEWRERMRDYRGAYADAAQMHVLTPELGAPLERMSRLATRAGHTDADARQLHALAEINPENLPVEVRDDSKLPIEKMPLAEVLLRAGYAIRVQNNAVARRLLAAAAKLNPDLPRPLELMYAVWKQNGISVEEARGYVMRLIKMTPRAEYDHWLLEMGATDDEQAALYRSLIALEPYEAKNYGAMAALELKSMTQHGAMEPALPNTIQSGLPSAPPSRSTAELDAPPVAPPQPPPPGSMGAAPGTRARAGTQRSETIANGQTSGSAEANYQHASDLDPTEPSYYYGLAQALDKRAAFPLEIMALNMALIGDPDNPDYKAARAKLP